MQNSRLCSTFINIDYIDIDRYVCATQSSLQDRQHLAVWGSQLLAHKGLAKFGFCLHLEMRIWQGRNQTISSSGAREREVSFGFVNIDGSWQVRW